MASFGADGESLSEYFRSPHVQIVCFYIFIGCDETESLGTESTNGPVVPVPNVRRAWSVCIMTVDSGKPVSFQKNLRHCQFIHHKSHVNNPGTEPRLPREAAD
jgi:hypothetical protein